MADWIKDDNGNYCSVRFFGSLKAAREALASLVNCTNCTNCYKCTNCTHCTGCRFCEDCHECSNYSYGERVDMKFELGDVVRLKSGWTPMVVIRVHYSGRITAKYAHNPSSPVTKDDYIHNGLVIGDKDGQCRIKNSKTRFASQFTHWEGGPIPKENYIMKRGTIYKSKATNSIFGTFLTTASDGSYVLESKTGFVFSMPPDLIEEVRPYTFKAGTGNASPVHFTLPEGVDPKRISVGDLLLRCTGLVYKVFAVDTNNKEPLCEFKGEKIFKEPL